MPIICDKVAPNNRKKTPRNMNFLVIYEIPCFLMKVENQTIITDSVSKEVRKIVKISINVNNQMEIS